MKKLLLHMGKNLAEPLVAKSIIAAVVLSGFLYAYVPSGADANTCVAAPPQYPCPATLTIYESQTATLQKNPASGTLPNGHQYCGYSVTNGDVYAGAYDKVLGRPITFARSVSCTYNNQTCFDANGQPYSCGSWACNRNVGQYVDMNPINQGAKCVTLSYSDPEVPASLGAGTDSNYWVGHDCTSSYSVWFALDTNGNGGFTCQGSNTTGLYCYTASWTPTNQAQPANWCVDVHF